MRRQFRLVDLFITTIAVTKKFFFFSFTGYFFLFNSKFIVPNLYIIEIRQFFSCSYKSNCVSKLIELGSKYNCLFCIFCFRAFITLSLFTRKQVYFVVCKLNKSAIFLSFSMINDKNCIFSQCFSSTDIFCCIII